MSLTLPTIQNYTDYREYLHDWYQATKATNSKLSYRYLSKKLGLKSPNHLHLVTNKKRHLSNATLTKMLKLLALGTKESSYFKTLFERNTTKQQSKTKALDQRLAELREQLVRRELPPEQHGLLRNSIAWFLAIGAPKFQGLTMEEICKQVKASILFDVQDQEISHALDALEALGKVEKRDEAYFFEYDKIHTDWDFNSSDIKQFHYNNLSFAMRAIPWDIDKRFFSNVSVPANQNVIDFAKSEIRSLCQRILEKSSQEILSPQDIKQAISLEFAMFPFFAFPEETKTSAASNSAKKPSEQLSP